MNNQRWYEFAVNITLKINNGSFGIRYERQGEFRFCAQRSDAAAIAGHFTKGAMKSISTTKMVQIVGMVPVSREVFPLESPAIKSCWEVASELEELEAELEVV
jgi:hypothetical protein